MYKICLDRFGKLHVAKTWVDEDKEKNTKLLCYSYCGFDFNPIVIGDTENLDKDTCKDCIESIKFYKCQDELHNEELKMEICNSFGINHFKYKELEDLECCISVVFKDYFQVNFRFFGVNMLATISHDTEKPCIVGLTGFEGNKGSISVEVKEWFTQTFLKKGIIKEVKFLGDELFEYAEKL